MHLDGIGYVLDAHMAWMIGVHCQYTCARRSGLRTYLCIHQGDCEQRDEGQAH